MTPEILFFFEAHPQALPLYRQLEERVLAEIPDTQFQPRKSQITLRNRRVFGAVSFLPVRKKGRKRTSP